MTETLVSAFVTFFVVVDPLGLTPIFVALTEDSDVAEKRRTAVRGVVIAGAILLFFAFFGRDLLGTMGIGLPAFRTAGGVLLFFVALEMVFQQRSGRRRKHVSDTAESGADDVSVFPLAIPLIAGPGAMTTVLLLMSRYGGDVAAQAAIIGVILIVLAITLVLFLSAARFSSLLSETVTAIISRLLGVLLAALSAQYVFDGIRGAFLTN